VLSDPVNNASNPKSIPGAVELYTLRITNQGSGSVDSNTLAIVDAVPTNTALDVRDAGAAGSGPVVFVNGTPASGLTYAYTALNNTTDSLEFSHDGGATWTYVPTPNANGCDPNVTHIRVRLQGAMAGSSAGGNPYFELRFRVRVN
jgi:trimeric autotransporter adhesin